MPLTPLHFGPSTLIGLPLKRYLDLPVFVFANVVIDLEPLAVIVFGLTYPQHGYLHTFLIGGILGVVWGLIAYTFRVPIGKLMNLFKLDYSTTLRKMLFSAVLGVFFHVFLDSFLYSDVQPFYPFKNNPLLGIINESTMNIFCTVCFIPAFLIFVFMAYSYDKRHGR